MNKESLALLSQTVREALLTGGEIIRQGALRRPRISYKSASDPVTEIDLASEKAVQRIIKKRFPSHIFLAEESTYKKGGEFVLGGSGRYRWIVDPLDGTVNFVHRIPHSCISVGVECDGRVLAGGVYDPYKKELFMAVRGKGATMNGRPIHVSREKKLVRSIIATGFPYDHQKNAAKHAAFVRPFLQKFGDLRRYGAAALDLSWIACGRFDAYFEFGLKPWDVAAGLLLVEEAGGKITDFQNKPMNLDDAGQTLATNGLLHPATIKIFKDIQRNLTQS